MTSYLLALSVGPVQDFIAAARRTRDLWYGSTLLSDLSKVVANHLKEGENLKEGGKRAEIVLIFPSHETNLALDNKEINIANQIIARVTASSAEDVRKIAEKAQEEASLYWKKLADKVLKKDGGETLINRPIWDSQINDVLELYAAWVPLPSESDDEHAYRNARQRLMALLSARKNTRDFRPGQGFPGIRKSLLDGARESVLPEGKLPLEQVKTCRELGIKVTEQNYCEPLDAAGVIKRVLGKEQEYPSVARVAADPWLRQLEELEKLDASKAQNTEQIQEIQKEIAVFNAEISALKEKCGDRVLHTIAKTIRQYKAFPYEGTIVYTERHLDIAQQAGITPTENNKLPFPELQQSLQNVYRSVGKPSPYLAVLCADGDRIGAALEAVGSLQKHQEFSQKLSEFAKEAKSIVEKHQGVCIYSGGDDVLALLPLDYCIAAAGELRKTFGQFLNGFKDKDDKNITLSVGIAIGHFMEELSQLRQWGKAAKELAKGKKSERDGLAVVLHTRGGGEFHLRSAWADNPDQQLQKWIEAFQCGDLPRTLPYELRQLLDLYEHRADPLIADAHRVLRAKNIRNSVHGEQLNDEIDRRSTYKMFEELTNMLLLAARISSHLPPPKKGMLA